MRSTATFVAGLLAIAAASGVGAQSYPIFAGDPVNSVTGRPWEALPGIPLLLPQPDGRYNPPIVDQTHHGDVDLVVRAMTGFVGATMPAPVASPPVRVAGGTHVMAGTEVPFTVIASDGSTGTPLGNPLVGPELNGLPVLVSAFADLDGDGWIGPTAADPAGLTDDGRELQELLVVGRQVAIFVNGVAQGSLAVWKGAPASAGGLKVVLTAMAYIGPFQPGFMSGNVPNGPGVATMMPFFPRLDPDRVVDGNGAGGAAGPGVRLGISLEDAFEPVVNDPVLGTPFALPTNGTSLTIDRAVITSGSYARVRAVRSSSPASFPVNFEVPLHLGPAGALWEDLTAVSLSDDGAGGATTSVRIVPVDLLDNLTDPPSGRTVTLVAGPGLRIASPDTDADPSREIVPITAAVGADIVLDDAGGANDGPSGSTLVIEEAGLPVDSLTVTFTPAGGGGGGGVAPTMRLLDLAPPTNGMVVGCTARRTIVAVASDTDGDLASVNATLSLDGQAIDTVALAPGSPPPGMTVPPGQVFVGTLSYRPSSSGALAIVATARDQAARVSTPATLTLPIAATSTPTVSDVFFTPSTATVGERNRIFVSAVASDDCGVRRVRAEIDRGTGFRRAGSLNDRGRGADAVAGDGVYSGYARVRPITTGTASLRLTVGNVQGQTVVGTPLAITVVP